MKNTKNKKAPFVDFNAQQGDVILHKVPCVPKNAKRVEKPDVINGRHVIALGEESGHVHGLMEHQVFEDVVGEQRFLTVCEEDVKLTHEKHLGGTIETAGGTLHKDIAVAPGVYEVVLIQEQDHFENAARVVRD